MTINTDGTRFGPKSGRSKKQSAISIKPQPGHACYMLTEIYIEPLMVDAELADQVWEAWDKEPAQRTICSVES